MKYLQKQSVKSNNTALLFKYFDAKVFLRKTYLFTEDYHNADLLCACQLVTFS